LPPGDARPTGTPLPDPTEVIPTTTPAGVPFAGGGANQGGEDSPALGAGATAGIAAGAAVAGIAAIAAAAFFLMRRKKNPVNDVIEDPADQNPSDLENTHLQEDEIKYVSEYGLSDHPEDAPQGEEDT
jgi:hypothetical protein